MFIVTVSPLIYVRVGNQSQGSKLESLHLPQAQSKTYIIKFNYILNGHIVGHDKQMGRFSDRDHFRKLVFCSIILFIDFKGFMIKMSDFEMIS